MMRRLAGCCYLVVLISFGCGETAPAQRAVEGTVTYAGKPVDRGMIMFQPTAGRLASASIQPDGKYTVSLPLGTYSVFLNVPPKLPEGFKEGDPIPPPDPNALPARYSQKESSGLTATIDAGGEPQSLNFDLD